MWFGGEVRRELVCLFGVCFVCSVWMAGWVVGWLAD